MELTKCLIVYSTFFASVAIAGAVIITPTADKSTDLVEATVEILTSCYKNQTRTVGLAGHSPEILLRSLWAQESLSVAVTNNASRKVNNGRLYPESQHKLQVFVISASSATQLKQIVIEINDTPWWNHMASFFIVDWSTVSKTGCSKVSKLLWAAWELDLLNAKVMCLHPIKGQLIYSYNPYTSRAPDHWHLEDTIKGKNGHPWTLFAREYREDNDVICEDLDFEKTNDLGGYEIRSTVEDIPECWLTDTNKTGIDSFTERDGVMAQYIFRALNATPNLRTHKATAGPGYSRGAIADIVIELIDGRSDIILNPRGHVVLENISMTYPKSNVPLYIATQSRGIESPLTKILRVLDNYSRFGLLLVALITFVFFKLVLRQTFVIATLNLLRIVLNSSLLTIPKNLPVRIYLACLFFLYVTILAIFQGKMASVLTMPHPVRNVDTIEDLLDLDYTVYGVKGLSLILFSDPVYQNRFVGLDTLFCLEYVFSNPSAACISTHEYLSSSGVTLGTQLHVSKNEILTATMVYFVRKNWPLEHRLNKILRILTEAYITQKTSMKAKERVFDAEKFYEKLAGMEKFTVLTLDQLSFAFVILGIGLGCASACFIVELAIKRVGLHVRRYIRNGIRDRRDTP